MLTSWPFFKHQSRKNKLRKIRKLFENRSPAFLAKLLIMQVYSEPSCSFVFILNKKNQSFFCFHSQWKTSLSFSFVFFYSVLPPGGGGGGNVGFIVTYRSYINCCILVNSVLQSLLSAFIQTQNVPVEGWRRYKTNFIMELQP